MSRHLLPLVLLCLGTVVQASNASNRPNIVVILTDDSGYSDLSIYGSEIPTPNIDALARNGLRFSKFYTNARCSPTRASLLTGQYPQKVGVGALARPQDETDLPGYRGFLDPEALTLAQALRAAGYQTLMSGKWHLGGQRQAPAGPKGFHPLPSELEKWPNARGFDEFYGTIMGHIDYFGPRRGKAFVRQTTLITSTIDPDFYATNEVTNEALRMLEAAQRRSDDPFFLYLAFHAPHEPLAAPEAAIERHRSTYTGTNPVDLAAARLTRLSDNGTLPADVAVKDITRARLAEQAGNPDVERANTVVAAMTDLIDQNVGRLVAYLRDTGELDNTLIVYLSDNGAAQLHSALGNWPFHGLKGALYEGGVATHAIVHWPNGLAGSDRVVQAEAHVIDWMPTLLEVAGGTAPAALAGESLVEILQGESFQRERPLFWDFEGHKAVLDDGWKWLKERGKAPQLFHLAQDPAEAVDLAREHPDRARTLQKAHEAWAAENHVMPWQDVKAAQKRRRPVSD